jgi:hypothetical protein
MKITYLGGYFEQDIFPMRGIAQTLMREYCRVYKQNYEGSVISSNFRDRLSEINNSEVVFINIDAAYEKEVYEMIFEELIKPKIIAISTELFDIFERKSSYSYFNYTGNYVREKLQKYDILNHINGTISGSLQPIKGIPHIYYPYLYAPSVYMDKISYMRSLISSNPEISRELRDNCCAVYKSPTEFREKICDEVEKLMKINYGGYWRNNDNRVKKDYDFNIIFDYYKKFEYVISIENDFHPGWITEKLINPLIAGSIPIYYAPFEFPDLIINKEACVILKDDFLYKDQGILEKELSKDRKGIKVFTDGALSKFEEYVSYWMKCINIILNEDKITHMD